MRCGQKLHLIFLVRLTSPYELYFTILGSLYKKGKRMTYFCVILMITH